MEKELRYKSKLAELAQSGNLREMKTVTHDREFVIHNNRKLVNLSSNDYMGVGTTATLWKPFLASKVLETPGTFPGSACSSRLQTGNHEAYGELEATLAKLFH